MQTSRTFTKIAILSRLQGLTIEPTQKTLVSCQMENLIRDALSEKKDFTENVAIV